MVHKDVVRLGFHDFFEVCSKLEFCLQDIMLMSFATHFVGTSALLAAKEQGKVKVLSMFRFLSKPISSERITSMQA